MTRGRPRLPGVAVYVQLGRIALEVVAPGTKGILHCPPEPPAATGPKVRTTCHIAPWITIQVQIGELTPERQCSPWTPPTSETELAAHAAEDRVRDNSPGTIGEAARLDLIAARQGRLPHSTVEIPTIRQRAGHAECFYEDELVMKSAMVPEPEPASMPSTSW